jgi:hypothetical protein
MRMTAGEAAGSPIPPIRVIAAILGSSYLLRATLRHPSRSALPPGVVAEGAGLVAPPSHDRRPFLTRNSHCVAADRLSISCSRHSGQRREIRAALVLRHVPPMLGDQNNHCTAVRDRSEQPTDCEAFVSLVQVAPLTISTTGVSLLEVRILSGGAISGAIAANPPPI